MFHTATSEKMFARYWLVLVLVTETLEPLFVSIASLEATAAPT